MLLNCKINYVGIKSSSRKKNFSCAVFFTSSSSRTMTTQQQQQHGQESLCWYLINTHHIHYAEQKHILNLSIYAISHRDSTHIFVTKNAFDRSCTLAFVVIVVVIIFFLTVSSYHIAPLLMRLNLSMFHIVIILLLLSVCVCVRHKRTIIHREMCHQNFNSKSFARYLLLLFIITQIDRCIVVSLHAVKELCLAIE